MSCYTTLRYFHEDTQPWLQAGEETPREADVRNGLAPTISLSQGSANMEEETWSFPVKVWVLIRRTHAGVECT